MTVPGPPSRRGDGGTWYWLQSPGQPAAWQWHPDPLVTRRPVDRRRWVARPLVWAVKVVIVAMGVALPMAGLSHATGDPDHGAGDVLAGGTMLAIAVGCIGVLFCVVISAMRCVVVLLRD